MFPPMPVQESLLDHQLIYRNDRRPRIKTIMVSIISIVILLFLLILMLILTSRFWKKKQPILSQTSTVTYTFSARNTTIPTTIKSSSIQATTITPSSIRATTTSIVSINNMTTFTSDSESKPNGCQLPLIPKYNTNKTIAAESELKAPSIDVLKMPITIALDSESNLLVADAGNFRVLKYIPNSKKGQIVLGHGTDRLPKASNIIGLLIDKNDLLYTYQHDGSYGGQIIIWPSSSKNGTVIMTYSGHVAGLAIDRDLNIYIAWGINIEIRFAPRYKESINHRVFGEPFIQGSLPVGASSIYVDANSNLFAIDTSNHRIQKTPPDDKYSETILQGSPTPVAIIGDCHNNLYVIDSNSSLIIYNSTGDVISTMYNAIDNPYYSDSWPYTHSNGKTLYIPDYFASLALDSKTGDLYVVMHSYYRVTKFTLNL